MAFVLLRSSPDLIYTSIYVCISQIAGLLNEHLVYPNGIAYVATKRYYFGVGGGSTEFINCMNKQYKSKDNDDNLKTRVLK